MTGTLVESAGDGAMLVWVKDGVIYSLRGANAGAVLGTAGSIH